MNKINQFFKRLIAFLIPQQDLSREKNPHKLPVLGKIYIYTHTHTHKEGVAVSMAVGQLMWMS